MSTDRILARYRIETAHPLEAAAAAMAGEQSSGTFVRVPGETDELRARHAAAVVRITELDTLELPSLPGSHPPPGGGRLRAAEVELSFPRANVGDSLPALFTQVAGNLFELGPFSGLRLLDLEVPEAFAGAQPGPGFGIEGTRRLAGVRDRPLIGTIIKPSVGLTPAATAELVDTLCAADIDFIKDDELIANPPYSPVAERARAVLEVIRRHEDRLGRRVMYACNISDTPEAMRRHHDAVEAAGGTCVMVNLIPVGLSALLDLRSHARLCIHGHRNGWGMFSRCPALGMDYTAFQKFFRMAGADHLHVNGLRSKFCESDASVIASARACQTPIHGRHTVMPVFSAGQSARQAPDTFRALGNTDLLFLAGGGIIGHPDGPAAGVASLREAWEAAVAGEDLETYARGRPALAAALRAFAAP
ncbi:MAG: ribulose 1,5-bisphosphate carboxylase [Puniceicoccaceae bacterium]|nr:MAG: ribulose 1,5-bisphosphate carboxylase [Puniceicoccaceae bacterium]